MRLAALALMLAGCGAAPARPARDAPPPARPAQHLSDLAVPERARPSPPPTAIDPLHPRAVYERDQARLERELATGERRGAAARSAAPDDVAESELWDPCVRQFVHTQPARVRRALTAALARYQTACGPDGAVLLQAARGIDGRARQGRSDFALVGSMSAASIAVALRVASCGAPPDADRIVIATERARWTSPALAFERDEYGCYVAELPLTRAVTQHLRDVSRAADAVVAFGGHDLIVSDEMKQSLRALLDALDALDAL